MRKLAVTYPWSSPFAYTDFVERALNMRHPDGWDVRWFRGSGWCVARMHNHGVEQALDWGADAVVFLDPDQIHPEDMLGTLVSHLDKGRDVVGAMVPLRNFVPNNGMKPFQSMAWIKDSDGELRRVSEDDGDVQQVHSVGTGVLLVNADLLDQMPPPWFVERIDEQSFNRFGGSDTRFVGRLRDDLSASVWVDTTICVQHLNIFQIDETFSDRFSDYTESETTTVGSWSRDRDESDGFGGWSIDRSCYRKIREMLPSGGTVLELGSGEVTKKLSEHYTVYSVEEDADRAVGDNCIVAPIKDGWYDADVIREWMPSAYDLILVDGPVTNDTASRCGFVDNLAMFDLSVPIVFDDVNRPGDDMAMQLIARITEQSPEVHRGHRKDFGVLMGTR